MKILKPNDQVFWCLENKLSAPLRTSIKTDVVIIGGGMAGLTAAQSFRKRGLSVVLLEKNYCGSGASGKSSGFITPDSEINLNHFIRYYGAERADQIWKFGLSGVHLIKDNIKNFSIACDYVEEDTLVVANSHRGFKYGPQQEYDVRQQLGYPSTLYSQETLPRILGSSAYYGGIHYSGTFGINTYRYCQAMKEVLIDSGVTIYEDTPALKLYEGGVDTFSGSVKADYTIVCVDRFMPDLDALASKVYHVQTFLMISAPLSDKQVRDMFPEKNFMMWDTDLIYTYFRLTGDNRLLLGGGNVLTSYDTVEKHNATRMAKQLIHYFKKKFPTIAVNFEYMWPGLIGISKDVVPIAGRDKNIPSIYYVTAATGLPWAAALGNYSAMALLDKEINFDEFFSPYRSYILGDTFRSIFGTRLTFALSNFISICLK